MPDDSEADARINIDQLLREAGWDPSDKRQVRTEVPIALETALAEADLRFPKKPDYILYDCNGRPLAVIEAKKNGIDPYRSKQQALQYARAILAPKRFETEALKSLPVHVPPLARQLEFRDAAMNHAIRLEQQVPSSSTLETLFQTLLHRAFDGSLTAKWREFHAKELLQEMEHQSLLPR